MIIRILSTAFVICAFFLTSSTEAVAEANIVPLKTIMDNGSVQSNSVPVSPETIAALMQRIHYEKEGFFTSDPPKKLFSKHEALELSKEIASLASSLQPQHAIAFATQTERVKGYLLFSGHQSIWYISSIEDRPAERITRLTDEYSTLDDAESSGWGSTIEKSYWKLSPQKDQSLYQNKPDWLLTAIKHIPAEKSVKKPDLPSTEVRSQATADTDKQWLRIERLHRLVNDGLITPAEYNSKTSDIIAEYELAHPAIEEQLELLHRLYQKKWIDSKLYQSQKKKLLESL